MPSIQLWDKEGYIERQIDGERKRRKRERRLFVKHGRNKEREREKRRSSFFLNPAAHSIGLDLSMHAGGVNSAKLKLCSSINPRKKGWCLAGEKQLIRSRSHRPLHPCKTHSALKSPPLSLPAPHTFTLCTTHPRTPFSLVAVGRRVACTDIFLFSFFSRKISLLRKDRKLQR